MSPKKQSSPPSQRRSMVAPLLIVGGLFAIAVLIIVASASNQRPAFTPQVSGAPRAQIDQTQIDHGIVAFEQQVESVFRLKNVGDRPLSILGEPRVELLQGC